VDLDPHSNPSNSPNHQDPIRYSSNNIPSTQDNDRQYQDSLYNNPSHSPLKNPFQRASSSGNLKDDGLEDQDIQKSIDKKESILKKLK